MARYQIKGPNGEIIGTASELENAKDIALAAGKKTKAKFTVVDTYSRGVKEKNEKIIQQIRNMRGNSGGAGGTFLENLK